MISKGRTDVRGAHGPRVPRIPRGPRITGGFDTHRTRIAGGIAITDAR